MKSALFIFFTIISLAANALEIKADFIVSADGSGNFRTVQEAINAVPDFRKKQTVIFKKKGNTKRN